MRHVAFVWIASLASLSFTGCSSASAQTASGGTTVVEAYAAYRYDTDSGYVPVSLPSDGRLGDVMTLSSGGRHTGPLVVSFPARVVVTATAYLSNQDTSSRSLQCQVQLRPQGGTAQVITFLSYDTLAMYDVRTWTQTTGLDVPAGTYDLALQCSTGLANPGGRVFYADLTATANSH
jgi:hypothetical protein